MKALMIATLTILSVSIAHAGIKATDAQLENAKKAAITIVESIAQDKAALLLAGKAGWRLSINDPAAKDQTQFVKAIPIQLLSRKVNRIAVRMSLHAISPEGKVKWFAGGNYRVLVDLKDDGEVIAAEINFFDNLMSYEEMTASIPSHE